MEKPIHWAVWKGWPVEKECLEVAACSLEPVGKRGRPPTYHPAAVTCTECWKTQEFKKRTHFPIVKA